MYHKHGAYWYVKGGKWSKLGKELAEAMQEYTRLQSAPALGGMAKLIDKALAHHSKKIKPNTLAQYTIAADRLKVILAEFEPQQVQQKHVAAIKVSLSGTPNMANRILSFLRIVFSYAVEWQLVDNNPCIGVRRHEEKKRNRYITDREFEALMAHSSDSMRVIFEMAYLTGQRIGDVLKIRLSDISPDGVSFVQEKTGSKLIVTMTPDIADVIARTKALPRKVRGLTLFCGRGGRPVSYDVAKEAFARIRVAAGVANVTIHDLRAKSLTDADEEGKDAQKLGGHTDARMTARYLRGKKPTVAIAPNMPKKSG
jgi:integrase